MRWSRCARGGWRCAGAGHQQEGEAAPREMLNEMPSQILRFWALPVKSYDIGIVLWVAYPTELTFRVESCGSPSRTELRVSFYRFGDSGREKG